MVSFVHFSTLAFSVPIALQILVLIVSWFYIRPNWLICPIRTQVVALVSTLAIWFFNLFAIASYNPNYLNVACVIMVMFWLAIVFFVTLFLNEKALKQEKAKPTPEKDETKRIDILV
jgi:uncharacterized membrane protein